MSHSKDKVLEIIADGRTDKVFDLAPLGLDPKKSSYQGVSMIKWCAYYGDVSAVKYLISTGTSLNDLGENYDLNGAVFHGQWRLVQYLIEQGADVNYPLAHTGETPLHQAVSSTRVAYEMIVMLLLHHGADPNMKTIPGAESGSFMRDVRTKGETALHRAAAYGSTEIIEMLLSAGADKSVKDAHGDSPISWASWHRRKGMILYLLGYDDHTVRQAHVDKMPLDHRNEKEGLMQRNLLGELHLNKIT